MAACKNCGHNVAASSWRCYSCGSETPTDAVLWGKVGMIAVGLFAVGLILVAVGAI